MKTPTFDFVGRIRTWMIVSGVMLLVSVLALTILRLNLSIEFVGGSSFVLEGIAEDVSGDELRQAAEGAGATGVTAQLTRSQTATGAIVRTAALEPGSDTLRGVRNALTELARPERIDETFVGPSWGQQISRKALEALVVFLIVVMIYISVRLEPKMAGAAVIALVHDVVITIGVYALLRFQVSPATVIALLTILGYSLYDTVVVFDRVDETAEQLGEPGRRTYAQVVNASMNQVLWRSVNTSLTSLLPVGALLFLGARILGASTLEDLALALFVGMALGTYSSLFVAGPLLAWWKMREPEHRKLAAKVAASGEDPNAFRDTLSAVADPRIPITTEYVRGKGKRPRRRR